MNRFIATCILASAMVSGATASATSATTPAAERATESTAAAGSVERLDPALDLLLAADALLEKVADGFQFIEGPVWIGGANNGELLFSDIPANKIYRWSQRDGTRIFLEPVMPPGAQTGGTGGSNGLVLAPDGRIVLCEHGNRQLSMVDLDGHRSVLAEHFRGKRFNSPNDGVFFRDGSLAFTDPPYGLRGQDSDPAKELGWNGIYRLWPDGTITLLNDQQTRPNGIGLLADETVLIVANSDRPPNRFWMAYPVEADGSLGEGRVFFDANELPDRGVPDGLTVDHLGNVWATGPGGVLVLSPDGAHLGTVRPAELPANAGWGDDGKTLYMTARTGLYRIRTLSGSGAN